MSDDAGTMKPMSAEVVRALVANHREFLRFVTARVDDRELAREIVQEAFARGIGRIESLRDPESATAWFYRSLRNAVIDHHRRKQTSQKALAAFAAELDDPVAPPEDARALACQCVVRLAETLKPEYARALAQIEVAGVSVTDFAEQEGITASNAAVRVFRARRALRARVRASCGACADHGCLDCTCARPNEVSSFDGERTDYPEPERAHEELVTDETKRLRTKEPPMNIERTTLAVDGMTCGSCVRHVEQALRELAGVRTAKVDLESGKVSVEHDAEAPGAKTMIDALGAAGYPARVFAG